MLRTTGLILALAIGGVFIADSLKAADPGKATVGHVTVATNFRASKLMGMPVKNAQGDKLGTIDDIVVNMETGKIDYVALSHGGVLGIGDKLFAIPLNELSFTHGQDGMFFMTNLSKETLAAAPGFDKDKWPDVADEQFRNQVDQYYQARRPR